MGFNKTSEERIIAILLMEPKRCTERSFAHRYTCDTATVRNEIDQTVGRGKNGKTTTAAQRNHLETTFVQLKTIKIIVFCFLFAFFFLSFPFFSTSFVSFASPLRSVVEIVVVVHSSPFCPLFVMMPAIAVFGLEANQRWYQNWMLF